MTASLLTLLGVPLIGAVLTWTLRPAWGLYAVTAAVHVVVLALATRLLEGVLQHQLPHAFGTWLELDPLGGLVLLVVAVVAFTSALYSIGYLHHEHGQGAVSERERRRYFALLHLFVFTMLLSAAAGNLGLLWTAIAATTLVSAPLVDFYGSHEPLEAAWKYVLLTTAGSMVALLGFLILYQAGAHLLGTSYDFSFPVLVRVAGRLPASVATSAFLLVLVGLGTKAGLAPMHSWLPDAHSQAPSPVCALLSGVELNCAMLGILRVYALTAPAAGAGRLRLTLLGFGLLSVLVGVVFLISQRDFKRLLAYSSIEHMGLIATGVGIGAPLAVFGSMLQMVNHAITKSLMFFATGNLLLGFRTRAIASVGGLGRLMPGTAVGLLAGGLAIAGAPPFNLFVSEVSILAGAATSRQWFPALALAGLLVLGFLAIVAPFNRMVFLPVAGVEDQLEMRVDRFVLVPIYLSLAMVLLLGAWVPGPLHDLLGGAAKVVSP
jgi:hydrogenase-4 component F